MEVERRIIFALNNKPSHFEKMPYYFSCTFSNIEKWCPSSSFIISSLLVRLSAAFSVPLTAITHFMQTFCQINSDHELLLPDISGSGRENVLLAQN